MAWTKYKEIRYALAGIPGENLTDFPKLVSIVADSDIASELSGGGGVKFTSADGSSDLAFGLYPSTALASGTILARVKIGSLLTAASVGDVIARLYYSSSESTTQNRAGVVSNGYALFMPLEEDPSGSAPQMRDWVTDTLLGTANGSMTNSDSVAGTVGKRLDFDGSNDWVDLTAAIAAVPITVEAAVQVTTFDLRTIVAFGSSGSNALLRLYTQSGTIALQHYDGTASNIGWNGRSTGVAYGVAGVWETNALRRLYGNGALIGADTTIRSAVTINRNYLGKATWSLGDQFFPGLIDELRISNVARSANWLAYAYADDSNNANTFSLSAEQGGGGGPTLYRRSPFVSPVFASSVIRGVA